MGVVTVDREPKTDGYLRGQLWNRPLKAAGPYLVMQLFSAIDPSEDPAERNWDDTGTQPAIAGYRSVPNLVPNTPNRVYAAPELKAWEIQELLPENYQREAKYPPDWEPIEVDWQFYNAPPSEGAGVIFCQGWLWLDLAKVSAPILLIERTSSDLIALPEVGGDNHNYYGWINIEPCSSRAYYSRQAPSEPPDEENLRLLSQANFGASAYIYTQWNPPTTNISASRDGFQSSLLQVDLSSPLDSHFIAQNLNPAQGALYGAPPGLVPGGGVFQSIPGGYFKVSPDDESDITYYP